MPKETPQGEWPDYAKRLGLNMQRIRIRKGMSQEQTAYTAGLSRYTYQKFEKGESMPGTPANPSLRNIMAIAQALGVPIEQLLPNNPPDLRAR